MIKLSILCLVLMCCTTMEAQSLKKYPVGNSGCSVYMFCDPKRFNTDFSEDSSTVYTSECVQAEITYGVICIKLLQSINDLRAAEEMMVSYLDFLKADFNIRTAGGYGKGHILGDDERTRGVVDYWKDGEGENWKIKGWTDGKFIGVLFAHTMKDLPEPKVNGFLDGLRFPETKKN